jgi:hypothetical protein
VTAGQTFFAVAVLATILIGYIDHLVRKAREVRRRRCDVIDLTLARALREQPSNVRRLKRGAR